MDFSLHSFILVIGLLVILFIIWDGLKKIRENKQSQALSEPLDVLVNDSSLEPGHEGLAAGIDDSYEELEIADDLPDLTQSSIHTAFAQEPVAVAEKKPVSDMNPAIDASGDGEHQDRVALSTSSKEPIADEVSASLDEFPLESFSAMDDETFDKEAMVESTLEPKQVKPKRPSAEQLLQVIKENEALQKKEQSDESSADETSDNTDIEVEDKPVPVLMEPIELGQNVDPNPPTQHELALPEFIRQALQDEPEAISAQAMEEDKAQLESFSAVEDPELAKICVSEHDVGERLAQREAAQEIFVINVLKDKAEPLDGAELLHIFKACDMRHGEMDIFHRFEEANAQGKIQFSVVNAIEPGSFDLSAMQNMQTPGISLFMSLPGPENAMAAFDAMAEVALIFARNFNATLLDESHSDLTPQTLEHYRHRIREFSRKHLSRKS